MIAIPKRTKLIAFKVFLKTVDNNNTTVHQRIDHSFHTKSIWEQWTVILDNILIVPL